MRSGVGQHHRNNEWGGFLQYQKARGNKRYMPTRYTNGFGHGKELLEFGGFSICFSLFFSLCVFFYYFSLYFSLSSGFGTATRRCEKVVPSRGYHFFLFFSHTTKQKVEDGMQMEGGWITCLNWACHPVSHTRGGGRRCTDQAFCLTASMKTRRLYSLGEGDRCSK